MYKSSFGAKADGPLADQEAYAPEMTTGKSEKRRESGTRALLPVSDAEAAQQRSSAEDLYSTIIGTSS